jgi:nitrate/TMAO reductase-like tetraheme cytochrome c subunit
VEELEQTVSDGQEGHAQAPQPGNESNEGGGSSPDRRGSRSRWPRRWRNFAILASVLILVGVLGLGGAGYYTSRPAFCGSCHIMGPYYRSWSRDVHGKKVHVRCVDCHYAPGERHTIKAKFKGLSQLASYFSGRYGASRPRAHVNNASCLTASCHGDREYLTKSLLIGEPRVEKRIIGGQESEVVRTPTVTFVHQKHLEIQSKLDENEAQLKQVEDRLRQAAPADVYESILAAAMQIGPAPQREKALRGKLERGPLEQLLPDALQLSQLKHRETRLQQLAGLKCSACHGYDPSGKDHLMPADLETCFICHFNNQGFNENTGECLKCHEPPTRKILVHDQAVAEAWRRQFPETTQPIGPVLMDHRDIVKRGVNCASCHLDVIQGQATVTVRDCSNCHDQRSYLENFATRDTNTVEEYHRVHVKAQRARCADCHHAIQHRLIDPQHVATSAGFLRPILNNCEHCHPNHHHEQVELLMGVGGVGVLRPMPNAMFGSRLNCTGCHTKPTTDMKGDELVEASQQTCVGCHGADYKRLFEQWRNELAASLQEAEAALDRVDKRIEELRARGVEIPSEVADLVASARENVLFVKAGNGIHNKNYALRLLDLSISDLDQAMGILTRE